MPILESLPSQTKVLNLLWEVATEARQAVFAARAQTNPKKLGGLVGKTVEGRITESPDEPRGFGIQLGQQTRVTADVLQKAEETKWESLTRKVLTPPSEPDLLRQQHVIFPQNWRRAAVSCTCTGAAPA